MENYDLYTRLKNGKIEPVMLGKFERSGIYK